MGGTVGVIANDSARFTLFYMALTQLDCPPGTSIDWGMGSDRSRNRNALVERMLDRDDDWLLLLDDDHVFPSTLLRRLLVHNEPVVASLYLQRVAPFYPIAYQSITEEGAYLPVDLTAHNGEDLIRVVGAGSGAMLVRKNVFLEMPEPWFVHSTEQSEDLFFCERVINTLRLPVYLDPGARLGHIAPAATWPVFGDDGWQVGFTFSESATMKMPLESPYAVSDA